MGDLVKIDDSELAFQRAKAEISKIYSFEKAKEYHDKAEALLKFYKAQHKERGDVQNKLAELKILAAHRAGQILKEMAERGERHPQGGDQKSNLGDQSLILADLEISYFQSHIWQTIARLTEGEIEEYKAKVLGGEEDTKELTEAGIYRYAQGKEPKGEEDWLRYYDVWNFPFRLQAQSDEYGEAREAQCPAQVILNFIYYFTNEGDLIVDPMAGGGATTACARALNRRSLCYDIKPCPKWGVRYNDLRNGYPEEAYNCDAIFIDPPYHTQKKEAFEEIPYHSLREFKKFWEFVFKDSYRILKPGGKIGFLITCQTQIDLEGEPYLDFLFILYEPLKKAGFKPYRRVHVPLTIVQYTGPDMQKAKENKKLLGLVRDLLVFIKG